MNSLEFIEKEIDTYNQLKERAILRIADEDDEIELYKLQRHIDTLNERIPIFQQIKSELEAWESIKPRLKIKGAFLEMRFITKDHPGYRVIEKALEVEKDD